MAKWFGKGCKYFCGQWEESELSSGPDYKDNIPELCFCNHKDNSNTHEGSCNNFDCPLLKRS